MPKKANMTVTSRFRSEQKPVAMVVPPPIGVPVNHRLSFTTATEKLDWDISDFVETINNTSGNALFFLDTNFFTKEMDAQVWNALKYKRLVITPMVRNELKDWRETPFRNREVRDVIVQAESLHALGLPPLPEVLALAMNSMGAPYYRSIELQNSKALYELPGFDYYFNLLALRKRVGPIIAAKLEQQLGRPATPEEFAGDVQASFGGRGLRIAKKGLEAAASPNLLADEELVLSAVLGGILRGENVYILTWDIDLQEQFFKLLVSMESHYGAMLIDEDYSTNADRFTFEHQRLSSEQACCYETETVLVSNLSRSEYKTRLPCDPHPVYLTCLLLGGDKSSLKLTPTTFCAEAEMVSLLRVKAATGGLNTSRFEGTNVRVELCTFKPDEPGYRICIGKEKRMTIGEHEFSMPDAYDFLFSNERVSHYHPRGACN